MGCSCSGPDVRVTRYAAAGWTRAVQAGMIGGPMSHLFFTAPLALVVKRHLVSGVSGA